MTTICAECRWLSDTAKGARSRWGWLCNAAPIEPQTDVVTGDLTPAYARCGDINRGACSEYEAGPNCIHPKETAA